MIICFRARDLEAESLPELNLSEELQQRAVEVLLEVAVPARHERQTRNLRKVNPFDMFKLRNMRRVSCELGAGTPLAP